jgi:ribonucleoside-diphosphate reductase alpha chain
MGELLAQKNTFKEEEKKINAGQEGLPLQEKTGPETYSHNEAFMASLEYFKGDELAARVWVNKYAMKNSFGNLFEKTPDDMHHRMAKEISRIEKKYNNPLSEELIFSVLKDFKYIVPQGGPMTGIGNNHQIASLSNCFVIGNEGESDSYGGIMKIDQEQVQLMKRRGGVGTISIKHPDAENFIDAKLESGKVTGANVSVKITDEFMNAVINNSPFVQQYPVDSDTPRVKKVIDAGKLWEKIVNNAWKSAEPGILFWDTIIRESVPDCYADLGYKTVSTNPCGEIPLCPYDSCRLLAINLYSYVDNPFTENARFNFDLFKEHVGLAQRIMDDIIDLELEKIDAIIEKIDSDPETKDIKLIERTLWQNIREKAQEGRRTGIGITAEGDMIAALGLEYGSENAIDFSEEVHKTLAMEAYRSSVYLAKERGAFKIYDPEREKNNPFIQRLKEADKGLYNYMVKYGRRNISLLTIAPTGTTSLMTQTTSGIEPVFMPVYKRRRKVNPNDKDAKVNFVDEVGDSWEEYYVFHHKFVNWLEINGYNSKEVKGYSEEKIRKIVEKSPYHKATSNDVNWVSKVKMQGRIQKWVDHSISVTINLPAVAEKKLVGELYKEAWKSGCKGTTVYRDGSRTGVLLSNSKQKERIVPKRPKTLEAEVIRFNNNSEKWVAFVGLIDGNPYEIFTGPDDKEMFPIPKSITKGKIIKIKDDQGLTRYDFQYTDKFGYMNTMGGLSHMFHPEFWNYAKLISGVLRHGMPIPNVVNLVSSLRLDSENINTWKAGVERTLKRYIPDGTKAKGKCSECRSTNLTYQEGCLICQDCGASKCG